MPSDRVLGYLAQRFAVSEENLATEALTWLLAQSPAARGAMIGIARAAGADLSESLSFVSQVGHKDLGRPDVVGSDPATQNECFLVEAKFAAALTPRQPAGYLTRLPAGSSALLLVVAPTVRLPTLWVELLRAIPDRVGPAPAPSTIPDAGILAIPVGGGHVLALISWRDLMARLLQALRDAGEAQLVQDGEQLLALSEAMDAAAYVPLRPGDAAARVGRQIDQLGVVIDAVNILVKGSTVVERASTKSHGKIFYGWYASSRRTHRTVWYGFLPRVWAARGISPIWCQISVADSWSRYRLARALAPLSLAGGPGLFEDTYGYVVPLELPEFAGQEECVSSVLAQIESVVRCLDADAVPREAPSSLDLGMDVSPVLEVA